MNDEQSAVDAAIADPCPHCGEDVGTAWLVCPSCGEPIAAAAELDVGAKLADGRYQILGLIGRGGFGITYEVGDRRLQRRVAMKELFPEAAVRHGSMVLTPPQARAGFRAARDRFLREARVLARFSHPGIVRVYEVFEEHGTAYLVMELIDGRNLIDLLRGRGQPFTETEVLDVASRVAAALRPVHAAGVLHRDINPSNIMLTRHGRIVVIDFGLARDFDVDEPATVGGLTRVVTPGYAPLEQYRGEGRFGPATDVYGLAATCYRLATGRVPVAAMERDAGADMASPRRLNPAISKAASDAIMDGLELEPAHRPQDLDAFLARLGVRRLPDTPRSVLIDTVGDLGPTVAAPADSPARPPHREEPSPEPAVVGFPAEDDDALTGATRVVEPSAVAFDAIRAIPLSNATRAGAPSDATQGVPLSDATRLAPGDTAASPPGHAYVTAPPVHAAGVGPPIRPLTQGMASPGSDVRLPVAVGPHRPGRRKITVPLFVLAVAFGGAAPVLATAIVVLVALPLLATLGDSVAHTLRRAHGVAGGWIERRVSTGAMAPARFARNVLASVIRSSPVIGVGAALIAVWYAIDRTSINVGLSDGILRVIGTVVVGAVVAASREGSARFRTGLGLDEIVARTLPDGRTTERVVLAWLIVAILAAAALWLTPDPFPLP